MRWGPSWGRQAGSTGLASCCCREQRTAPGRQRKKDTGLRAREGFTVTATHTNTHKTPAPAEHTCMLIDVGPPAESFRRLRGSAGGWPAGRHRCSRCRLFAALCRAALVARLQVYLLPFEVDGSVDGGGGHICGGKRSRNCEDGQREAGGVSMR